MRLFRIVMFLLLYFYSGSTWYAQENNDTIRLSLNDALKLANDNNPEIITALREIDAAEGRILQAGRLLNAQLSVEANEIPSGFNLSETGELDVLFSQELEFFGKRTLRMQSAGLQKKIAELNYERIKILVASQVKKTYYNGLLSKQIIESIESNLDLLKDFLVQVTDRYQSGTSSYLDVIRAKVEITRLKNEHFDAIKNYRQVTGQLALLLKQENVSEYELTDSLFYQPLSVNKDTVLNHYSNGSNFLRITEISVDQNKSLLSLAEKNSLPDFNFGLAFQNRQPLPGNGFDQFYGLSVGISLPMFYSDGVRGDIQEAEANLSISGTRLQYAKIRVLQNIKTAYNNLSIADEQVRLFDTSLLKDIEDELKAGIDAYRNGQIDLLNLFDIYRIYRTTLIEYARTVYNALAALTDLEAASEIIE